MITAGALSVALLLGIAAAVEYGPARAVRPLAGANVPDTDRKAVVEAATSCPTLTPARLAGQVNAASSFGTAPVRAVSDSGGSGVAGLSTTVWKKWMPWPGAAATDRTASITALAHHMCQLVGQLRVARVPGDAWQLALAAHQAGVPAVAERQGIPDAAEDYVETVVRYAAWYAMQPGFGGAGTPPAPDPDPSGDLGTVTEEPAIRLPDEYLELVLAAGRTCAAVTPARLAAQLMAESGFRPSKAGTTGGQGIAQFLPEVWVRYVPASQTATAWDPKTAVPALGRTMCALVKEFGTSGDDAYALALATYHRGPGTIKQISDVTGSRALASYVALVQKYAEFYGKDARLGATVPSPSASAPSAPVSPSAPSSSQPSAKPAPSKPAPKPSPSTSASTATTTPSSPSPSPSPTRAGGALVSAASGLCLSAGDGSVGAALYIATCDGSASQRWEPHADGTLRSGGLCMDAAAGSTSNLTVIQVAACNGHKAQQWQVNDTEDLVGAQSGKCADVYEGRTAPGSAVKLWPCTGTANSTWRWRS